MPNIPNGYPTKLSDNNIQKTIDELVQYMASNGFKINTVLQISPLISQGQNELQKRINNSNLEVSAEIRKDIQALRAITDQTTENSKRSEKSARFLAGVSFFIAFISTILTIVFAIRGELSSNRWESNELQVLENQKDFINQQLNVQSMFLEILEKKLQASGSASLK